MQKRVPFNEPLWRPSPFLGPEDREARERTLEHLEGRRELDRQPLAAVVMELEFEASDLARIKARILGRPPGETVEFPRRVGRAVGER
jgi:hypothetical protein